MASTLGPYRLAARIGKGGMGEVWQAIHTPTERAVAIKMLSENEPSETGWRTRVCRKNCWISQRFCAARQTEGVARRPRLTHSSRLR